MRYKTGDKVLLRKDLDEDKLYETIGYIRDMSSFKNTPAEIIGVHSMFYKCTHPNVDVIFSCTKEAIDHERTAELNKLKGDDK